MSSPHFKKKQVPHYFKQDFPDQRFFPFREFLHSRIVKDALPDISYFDQMYSKTSFKPKKKSKLSPERLVQVFTSKEKLYKKLFTNGEVDIRTDFQIQLSKTSAKPIMGTKADNRINALIRKGRLKSKEKSPLDMFVDPEKRRRVLSLRKIPFRV